MQIPQEIVRLIQQRRYLLSSKARNQLHVGRFSTEDLLNSIIHGQVTKKERDETGKAKYKYHKTLRRWCTHNHWPRT